MNTSLRELIDEALGYEASAFKEDDEIDGGDLVEWFADWRARMKATLRSERPIRGTTPQGCHWLEQLTGALQALNALQQRQSAHTSDDWHADVRDALSNGGFQVRAGDVRAFVSVSGALSVVAFKHARREASCKR